MELDDVLEGRRVLDLTEDGCMLCGRILADLGADVIQIEPPGGSPTRKVGPYFHDSNDPEKSLTWFFLGLNKRGVTLDIESADGRDIFQRLVKTADFVLESHEPGHMASLGLGYDDLDRIRPGIIMTSITPFGQTGPYVHFKTTDIVGMALSGQMWLYGEADRAPVRIPAPQFFAQGGLQGAVGTMLSHYHREMTGEGQYIDQSCQHAIVLTLMNAAETWDINKVNIRGMGPGARVPRPPPAGPIFSRTIYQCRDGYVLAYFSGGASATSVNSAREMARWANETGYLLEFKDYEWFGEDATKLSAEFISRKGELLQEFLLTKTKAECLERASECGILLMPVNDAMDVVESPQLACREFFQPVEHGELGQSLRYPAFPVMADGKRLRVRRRAPLTGEHNDEIFGKELGIPPDKLARLKTQGVI